MIRLAPALLVGCVTGPGAIESPVLPDWERFVQDVQPVLETCANPACHGRGDRPLEVYAPGLHRADPDAVWLNEPLTNAELLANYQRARGFTVDARGPMDCDLICKPLAVRQGGCAHGGGVLHGDATNPDHQTLVEWLVVLEEELP